MRIAILWLAAVAACGDSRSEHAARTPPPAPAAGRDQPAAAEPPADAAPEPVADAGPDRALAEPMKFVETGTGDPPAHLSCPDRRACVIEYDFAYFVIKRGWKHHYLIDRGDPSKPIRAGEPSRSRIDRRASAAVAAVLRQRKQQLAAIHCGLAGPLRELIGLDASGYVPITVPAPTGVSPAPAPRPITPRQANEQIARVHAALPGTSGRRELFAGSIAAKMTADTFATPRISRLGQWMSRVVDGKETFVETYFVAVWSPESRKVYLLDRSWQFDGEPPEREQKNRSRDTERAVIALLQSLGVERASIDAHALCEYPTLVGTGEFLEARL
jgi:hypothetical protein